MSDKGWHRIFDDPIWLPDGRQLITLRHSATYIEKLPKRERDSFAWRAAIEALMLVAERGGDTMLPRIGVMGALYPNETAKRPKQYRRSPN
jgi:hypothetical protein